jgi:hypothetical protein
MFVFYFKKKSSISWIARRFWKSNFNNTHNMINYSSQCIIGWYTVAQLVGGTSLRAGFELIRFPMGSLGFFLINLIIPSLGSTQPLTEMSTRVMSLGRRGVKVTGA